jgi:hypothetical protein
MKPPRLFISTTSAMSWNRVLMIQPLRLVKVAIAFALIMLILTGETTPFVLSVIVVYLLISMTRTTWRMFRD